MNNFTLVFCIIHVTIHFSQSFSLLLIAPKTCTLTGDFTVVWIHLACCLSFCLRQWRHKRRLLWLRNTDSYDCFVFQKHWYISMHDIPPRHNSKNTRTFIECKGTPRLEWPGNLPPLIPLRTFGILWRKRLVTKCCVKKKICGSEYMKRGIVLRQTSWKHFAIQCQRELQILLKKREPQRNTDFMM